jgi:hypothetical protein
MATTTTTRNDDNWLGEQDKKLPSGLNVLTILTIIWNCLYALLVIWGFVKAPSAYATMLANQDKLDQLPGFMKNMMGSNPVENSRLALENRFPVLIIGLLGAFLCFFGALQMRKLKKSGFGIYILGDLVPFATYIFIGTDTLRGFGAVIGLCIVVLFVILYATQLKHMK